MAIGETNRERGDRLDSTEFWSLNLLKDEGVFYKQLSEFGYFVGNEYDYWPRTGLFIHRKTKKRGRGVHNLIKKVGKKK